MHVRELSLTNFRQFGQEKFSFRPGFNLLVGENGAGKTTILKSLSAVLAPKKNRSDSIPPTDSDIRLGSSEMRVAAVIANAREEQIEYRTYQRRLGGRSSSSSTPSKLPVLAYTSNEATCSSFIGKRVRRPKNETKEEAKRRAEAQLHDDLERETNLARIDEASFGSSRPLRSFMRKVLQQFSSEFIDFSWTFEPYACAIRGSANLSLKPDKSLHEIRTGLRSAILRYLRENGARIRELNRRTIRVDSRGRTVAGKLSIPILPPFRKLLSQYEAGRSDIKIISELAADIKLTPRIMVVTERGRFSLDQLSDGAQRLFSILVDIARQLSLQSPSPREFKDQAALILIDEIDVHLHPKWQRQIVPVLQDLFPSCQFIATTHSPFVIQAVSRDRISRLGSTKPNLTDGDANSIEDVIEDIQGVEMPQRSKRAEALSKAAEQYFRLLKLGGKADANAKARAELEYRLASEAFTSEPALHALLKVELLEAQNR